MRAEAKEMDQRTLERALGNHGSSRCLLEGGALASMFK